MAYMTVPDWRTSKVGTRVRVALWLHTEVGAGGAFTKAKLRDAFPNVEQIDRRMRDLRPEGWVIATYREDRSLSSDELRLVREGGPVWERGYRPRQGSAVTDKERQAIFAADNYTCAYCGINGGECYPDDALRTAKLTLSRVTPLSGGPPQLLTACDRCHVAARDEPTADLHAQADALDEPQRQRLLAWIKQGGRKQAPEEQLWARYRRLPLDARQELEKYLGDR